MRSFTSKALVLIAAAAASVSLLGCTRSSPSTDKDSIFVGISAPPATLDPRTATDATGQRLVELLFSPLVRIGEDLKPHPYLAEKWTEKNQTVTFSLRKDFFFAPGRPITAHDVAYAFDVYSQKTNPMSYVFDNIGSWKAQEEYVFAVTMKKPDAQFLSNLNLIMPLPREIIARDEAEFTRTLPGGGPFLLLSRSENEIILQAKAAHPVVTPAFKRIVFKVIRDDNTRYLKAMNQEIDVIQNDMPEIKVPSLKSSGHFQIFAGPGLNFNYLLVNFKNPQLRDLRLRQAIASAIDREEIIKYKLQGLAEPATSAIAPINPFHDSSLSPPHFSISRAKELVKSLENPPKALIVKSSNIEQVKDNAVVMAYELQKVGIPTEVKSYEWGTFYNDIKTGSFDLALMRIVGVVDPDLYREFFAGDQLPPQGKNRGAYKNLRFDELVYSGREVTDFKKRKAIYDEVQKIFYDELGVIPLWYNKNICIVHKRIKNYLPLPNGSYFPIAATHKSGSE